MKRILALGMCLAFAVGIFAFTACDSTENMGIVKGSYKEATSEDLNGALSAYDTEAMLGDTSSPDWSFGFSVEAKENFSLSGTLRNNNISVNESLDLGYKLVADLDDAGAIGFKGSGSLDADVSYDFPVQQGALKTENSGSIDIDTKVYNDSNNLYFTYDGVNSYVPIDFDDFIGDTGFGFEIDAESGINFADVAELINAYSLDVYMDTSDGLKIKLSSTEETFAKLASEIGGEFMAGANLAYTLSTFKFDFYLSIDSEGKFSAFGVNFNVAADVTLPVQAGGGSLSVNFKGGLLVSAYSGTVELPDLSGYAVYGDGSLFGGYGY